MGTEDLAKQLKQEAVACRIKSRNLLDKAKNRSLEANKALLRDDNPDNDSEAANQIQQLRQELQRIFSNNK